jgi:hypothetical protein
MEDKEYHLISDESWIYINRVLQMGLDDDKIPLFWDCFNRFISGEIEYKAVEEFIDNNVRQ